MPRHLFYYLAGVGLKSNDTIADVAMYFEKEIILELDFEGTKLVDKCEHCHVEKQFKGNKRADKK